MRIFLGLLVLLVLGFIAFVILSGIGFMTVLILKVYPWWQILSGTLFGTALVFIWLIIEKDDGKE